jgi:hypothetical protein
MSARACCSGSTLGTQHRCSSAATASSRPSTARRPCRSVLVGLPRWVTDRALEPGDRVLFFTDGLSEEHRYGGEEFGETRLRDLIERAGLDGGPVQETVRRLSHSLMLQRGGVTTDDATLLCSNGAAEPPTTLTPRTNQDSVQTCRR